MLTGAQLDTLVRSYLRENKHRQGEVGIEIEVEGTALPRTIPSHWVIHEEHSLRGESAEYVLRNPVDRTKVPRVLNYLRDRLLENPETQAFMGPNTSVHIHLNVQGMTLRQLYTYLTLQVIFDDLLVEYSGPTRKGNLFCLRAKDAEYMLAVVCDTLRRATSGVHVLRYDDTIRYSSINLVSLGKYGSVEIRSFRGTVDPDEIATWIEMLLCIKDASLTFRDPLDVIESFSILGQGGFLRRVLPPRFINTLMGYTNAAQRLQDGMRLAQEIAFAATWEAAREATQSEPYPAAVDNNPPPPNGEEVLEVLERLARMGAERLANPPLRLRRIATELDDDEEDDF